MMEKDFASHPHTVFDAKHLFENPESNFKALSERIKSITYSSEMLNKWTKGIGDQFRCIITQGWGEMAKTNAWNGPARNSTGIVVQKGSIEAPVPVEKFPLEVHQLIKKCEQFYKEICKNTVTNHK